MEFIYFSKENFKRIYKILHSTFKKKYKFSLKERPKYKQTIIDIMKYIYSKRENYNIPDDLSIEDKSRYLTQKLIKLMIFYETKNHEKKSETKDEIQNMPSPKIIQNMRPKVVSNKEINSNLEGELNSLLEARKPIKKDIKDINFSDNNQEFNNINIQDKYSEITKQREADYDNFRENVSVEPEMSNSDKTVLESLKMEPDNVDIDDVLDNYQLLNTQQQEINTLTTNYSDEIENEEQIKPIEMSIHNAFPLKKKRTKQKRTKQKRTKQKRTKQKEERETFIISSQPAEIGGSAQQQSLVYNRGRSSRRSSRRSPQRRSSARVPRAPVIAAPTPAAATPTPTVGGTTENIKYHTLILDLGDMTNSNNPRIIGFGSDVANTNGGANVTESWDNVISVKINRLIVSENPIFRESIVAEANLETISGRLAEVSEEFDIAVINKSSAQTVLETVSGAYNVSDTINRDLINVDPVAALNYELAEEKYQDFLLQQNDASGFLYKVATDMKTNLDNSKIDNSSGIYPTTVTGLSTEYLTRDDISGEYMFRNEKNKALANRNQSLDYFNIVRDELYDITNKKYDALQLWNSISGYQMDATLQKRIDIAANILVQDTYRDYQNALNIEKDASGYLSIIASSVNTINAMNLTDIKTIDSSGQTLEKEYRNAIDTRDLVKNELLEYNIKLNDVSGKKYDALQLWNSISGYQMDATLQKRIDIAANILVQDSYRDYQDALNIEKDASGYLSIIASGAATIIGGTDEEAKNLSDVSGQTLEKEYRNAIDTRDLGKNEFLEYNIKLNDVSGKKYDALQLWNSISGYQMDATLQKRIDIAANILVQDTYRDYQDALNIEQDASGNLETIRKTAAVLIGDAEQVYNVGLGVWEINHFSNPSGALLGDSSGGLYLTEVDYAISKKNQSSDLYVNAVNALSDASGRYYDATQVWNSLQGYYGSDGAAEMDVSGAYLEYINASGDYTRTITELRDASNNFADKQLLLDWRKSRLDTFTAVENVISLKQKYEDLCGERDALQNLSGGDEAAAIQLKIANINYENAVEEFTRINTTTSTLYGQFMSHQTLLDWRKSRLDTFTAVENVISLKEKYEDLYVERDELQNLSGGDEAAAIQLKIANINYENASDELSRTLTDTINYQLLLTNKQTLLDWRKSRLDTFTAIENVISLKEKYEDLCGERDALQNLSGGDEAATVQVKIANINYENAVEEYSKASTRYNDVSGELFVYNLILDWRQALLDIQVVNDSVENQSRTITSLSGKISIAQTNLNTEENLAGISIVARAKGDYLNASGLHTALNDRVTKVTTDKTNAETIANTKSVEALAAAEPFLLVTTDTLPTNIVQSEDLPKNIFAKIYPDRTLMGHTHFINADEDIQKFSEPYGLTGKLEFFIKRYKKTDAGTDWVYTESCQLIMDVGERI